MFIVQWLLYIEYINTNFSYFSNSFKFKLIAAKVGLHQVISKNWPTTIISGIEFFFFITFSRTNIWRVHSMDSPTLSTSSATLSSAMMHLDLLDKRRSLISRDVRRDVPGVTIRPSWRWEKKKILESETRHDKEFFITHDFP